jgi:hypothetical protein
VRGQIHPLTRALLALFIALALVAGSVEAHDASAAAEHLAGRGTSVQVAEGASHPNESRHVERSETRVHPVCPACLLQLQTVAAGVIAPVVLPLPAGEDAPAGPVRASRPSQPSRLGSPRGPPALSER